jgi:hypothetical protein
MPECRESGFLISKICRKRLLLVIYERQFRCCCYIYEYFISASSVLLSYSIGEVREKERQAYGVKFLFFVQEIPLTIIEIQAEDNRTFY